MKKQTKKTIIQNALYENLLKGIELYVDKISEHPESKKLNKIIEFRETKRRKVFGMLMVYEWGGKEFREFVMLLLEKKGKILTPFNVNQATFDYTLKEYVEDLCGYNIDKLSCAN